MNITVNPAQNSTQEIFEPGTIVVSKEFPNQLIFVTDVSAYYNNFKGIVLQSNQGYVYGDDDEWNISDFTLFVGNVILEQS